jgi:hypothetical protein
MYFTYKNKRHWGKAKLSRLQRLFDTSHRKQLSNQTKYSKYIFKFITKYHNICWEPLRSDGRILMLKNSSLLLYQQLF